MTSPLRRHLEHLLADARARLALHDGQPGDVGRDAFDTILAAQARERAATHRQSLVAQVRAIEEAIARVDAGTYEKCSQCGAVIGVERLRALPAVETCIECAREAERA